MIIKNRLWELMAIHEVSSTQVFNATGISRSTLSALKHNKSSMIQIRTLGLLCDYFEIQPGDFFKTK